MKAIAVNRRGVIPEFDLGPVIQDIVKYFDRFNPAESWDVVTGSGS